jgi:hypothetical protein
MSRITKLGAMGIWILVGAAQALAASGNTNYAQTTNYLVQNVNVSLTAYLEQNSGIVFGALSTKQMLAFLSGATNYNVVLSTNGVQTNTFAYSNATVFATNFWLLPTNDPGHSYYYTDDYVVTPTNGGAFYTNNIDFTNDIFVTRSINNDVISYAFNNTVTFSARIHTNKAYLNTSLTAYILQDLQASFVAATPTNVGSGAVFALSGEVISNVPTWVSNYTYLTNPDFVSQRGTKLLYVTPIVSYYTNSVTYTTNISGTNSSVVTNHLAGVTGYALASNAVYVARYTLGKTNVDTVLTNFLSTGSSYQSVQMPLRGGETAVYGYDEIDFDNMGGTSFSFVGFDSQILGPLVYNGNVICPSVMQQRKMIASDYSGSINGPAENTVFSYATAVVNGTITIGSGHVEDSGPTP